MTCASWIIVDSEPCEACAVWIGPHAHGVLPDGTLGSVVVTVDELVQLSDGHEDISQPSAVAETEFQWHLRHLKWLLEHAKAELPQREWDALRDILLRQLEAGQ